MSVNIFDITDNILLESTVINEAVYIGKNKDTEKLEQILTELKNESLTGKVSSLRKLEDHLAEMFNVSDVIVDLGLSTLTIKSQIRYTDFPLKSDRVVSDRNGIRFNNKKGKKIIIFIGLNHLEALESEEMAAVLLHEIGHSMYSGILSKIILTPTVLVAGVIFSIMVGMRQVGNLPILKDLQNIIGFIPNYLGGKLIDINMYINRFVPINAVTNIMKLFPSRSEKTKNGGPASLINPIAGYDDEKFSDSFATAYGYGKELSSGLLKLENILMVKYRNNRGSKLITSMELMSGVANDIVQQISTPHPSTRNRILLTRNYLVEASKEAQNEKLKKLIISDIKEIDELMEAISLDVKQGAYNNEYFAKALKQKLPENKFSIDDFRELLSFMKDGNGSPLKDFSEAVESYFKIDILELED